MASSSTKVVLVPVLSDNFSYLLIDESTKTAAVVDPQEPEKAIAVAEKEGVRITTVLTTHHHWDHAGGNEKIASLVPDLQVVGGDDRIPKLTKKVGHNDTIRVGNLTVKVLFTPCHTTGHVLYYVEPAQESPILFSGDTLFVSGCGRFFEGTADQMMHALIDVAGSLPKSTRVFCGHEYTVNNLKFAQYLEPENQQVRSKLAEAEAKRAKNEPTVPSTIGEELGYNPFMRVNLDPLKKAVKMPNANPVDVMAHIRKLKDDWKA